MLIEGKDLQQFVFSFGRKTNQANRRKGMEEGVINITLLNSNITCSCLNIFYLAGLVDAGVKTWKPLLI